MSFVLTRMHSACNAQRHTVGVWGWKWSFVNKHEGEQFNQRVLSSFHLNRLWASGAGVNTPCIVVSQSACPYVQYLHTLFPLWLFKYLNILFKDLSTLVKLWLWPPPDWSRFFFLQPTSATSSLLIIIHQSRRKERLPNHSHLWSLQSYPLTLYCMFPSPSAPPSPHTQTATQEEPGFKSRKQSSDLLAVGHVNRPLLHRVSLFLLLFFRLDSIVVHVDNWKEWLNTFFLMIDSNPC